MMMLREQNLFFLRDKNNIAKEIGVFERGYKIARSTTQFSKQGKADSRRVWRRNRDVGVAFHAARVA